MSVRFPATTHKTPETQTPRRKALTSPLIEHGPQVVVGAAERLLVRKIRQAPVAAVHGRVRLLAPDLARLAQHLAHLLLQLELPDLVLRGVRVVEEEAPLVQQVATHLGGEYF